MLLSCQPAVLAHQTPEGRTDSSFGVGGTVSDPGGDGREMALTDEGRIIVAGSAYTFTAFCFDSSGQLDPSFGTGGIADVDLTDFGEESFARAIRRDGKIVLGGHARSAMDFALVRLRKDSTPDPDFGAGGIVYTDFGTSADVIRRLVILPEDKILAVGTTREASGWKFAMALYMPDGSLDPAFGTGGFTD